MNFTCNYSALDAYRTLKRSKPRVSFQEYICKVCIMNVAIMYYRMFYSIASSPFYRYPTYLIRFLTP